MDRRRFLKTATLGSAGATGLAAPAIAQENPQISWRMTSSFPKSLDTIYGGGADVAQYVREATDGAFDIQVFAGGEIVPGLQAADAVQNGTVEMCHTAAYYYVGKSPTWALGGVIPYGLNNRGMNAWLYYGGGLDQLNEFYGKNGLHYLPAGNTGAQMGGWFRNEINSLADMEGLQMRIGGLAGRVMERVGVVPQQVAGGDIYPSLERGTIDAAEWVGPYDDQKLGFYQVAPYYYYPGWWEGNLTLCCFVNQEQWDGLPDRYKALLQTASRAANTEMMAEYDYKNPTALRELVQNGAQLRRYPDEVLNATYDAAMELYSELRESEPDWGPIYDSMMAFQAEHFLWQQVSESTFAQFMQAKQSAGELPAQQQ
ncbi:TRAP-type mannitol/chloroaromatic compound transport system, substrate-binding protein [Palleronia salina]|uniref:TRAP-type mannitol/chloroaromatic compound transport system, substrate-binding protein n=1 Tax=Palleronia salina TaxID=313368 RepID=A0A1M6LSR8_9RHOB|nr:TRAP transporter substrate-binding protein [Palleronia salina]SHJ74233.1 TRAP-type mannitol/chloroaromatic compound transport system, substrate-binding protein [Palleronia salina]